MLHSDKIIWDEYLEAVERLKSVSERLHQTEIPNKFKFISTIANFLYYHDVTLVNTNKHLKHEKTEELSDDLN